MQDDHTAAPDGVGAAADGTERAEAAAAAAESRETGEREAEAPGGGEAAEDLTKLLEDARAKADERWDQLLRARAEMENLKRRHERELENAHRYALDNFVRELLQVWDSLELGHSAAQEESAGVERLREGTELTLRLFRDVMSKFGVEQLDPEGERFNPDYHQAMSMQPRGDMEPNRVATVVQRGYLLNGRLVRPALVIVSQAPG
jgi:molecular chaperone GrpE